MDEILQSLLSPVWWFSVVVAAVAVNLGSAYLKRPLDDALSRNFQRWRKRTTANRRKFDADVKRLSVSQHRQIMESLRITRKMIVATLAFGGAFMSLCGVTYADHVLKQEAKTGEPALSNQILSYIMQVLVLFFLICAVMTGRDLLRRQSVLTLAAKRYEHRRRRRSNEPQAVALTQPSDPS